jgi:phosphoglycerate dehydrogenase-like enzyme
MIYWSVGPVWESPEVRALRVPGVDLTIVTSLAEFAAVLPGADGVAMVDPGRMGVAREVAELLRAPATSLRWIHILTAGREGLLAAGVPETIAVTGPDGAHAPALAEHTLAFMLAFGSLAGKTLAIVGLGHAGREVAKRARACDMRVLATTRTPRPDPLVDDVRPLSALHDVLRQADFVALTIALAPETWHLIDAAALAACKPTAYLTNIARGGLIDETALLAALRSGTIAGAGLDAAQREPLPPDDPLWDAPNLIVSPHCAGTTSPMTHVRAAARIAENLSVMQEALRGTGQSS